MAFETLKYEANSGDIHPIRVNSAYVTAIGAEPAGAISNDLNARTRKGSREFGLRARGHRFYRVVGTGQDTFRRYAFVPKLTEATWSATPSSSVTFAGHSWTFLGRVEEDVD